MLIVLLDDVGFGAASTFGGPCRTPTADRLAAGGLRYNRFHTTALCAPTRARDARRAATTTRWGWGASPRRRRLLRGTARCGPNTKAPLAVTLKLNGYSTAQFGKCHEVPVWQSSPMGPFDAWPSGGGGFETFYGFIGGENNQWDPALYDGTTPVEPPATPEEGYHLTEDLTDRAVSWIRQQKALMPDKPFFVYFAPGATHAPHHVPKEWADRYAGAFDDGWDVQRERTFARQKELGVIPADAELTARHAEIPAWDDMPDEMKPVLAREMEVYAGFLEHTDYHVGRLIDTLADLGDPRRHARLLHHRRQRRVGRGHPQRRVQRDGQLQRHGRAGDPRVHDEQARRVRLAQLVQPLRGRLVVGDEHPLPVDQADRLPLGRHPQRHHRALAPRHRGARWSTHPVHPRHRRRSHHPRSGRAARTDDGQRCPAVAHGGHQHAVHVQRRRRAGTPRPPVLRDVRQPRHLPPRLERRHQAPHPVGHGRWRAARLRRRPVGALRRQQRLQPGPQPRSRTPRDAGQAATPLAHRSHEVQRAADGRPHRRAAGADHRRPTHAHPRELPAVLRRHGTPLGEQRRQHQEQVVLGDRRARRPRQPARTV